MHLDFSYAKQHWKLIAGGVFGLLVLYYVYTHFAGSSSVASNTSTNSTDATNGGTSTQVQQLDAAADLTSAQINGQIVTSQIAGQVQETQTAANLQLGLAQTAAQLSLGQQQTSANETVALGQESTDVSLQQIQSDAAVKQTAIQGRTLEDLESTNAGAQVSIAGINADTQRKALTQVGQQITQIQDFSKHASTDYQNIAPIIALETGQGEAAATIGAANAGASATATATKTSAISTGINTLLTGLFA